MQEMFRHYNKVHTLSMIMAGVNQEEEWVKYVQNNPQEFDIQLHGWEHEHYPVYTEEAVRNDLDRSLRLQEELFGKRADTWYLPWNGWYPDIGTAKVPWLRPIAKEYGLKININCSHIGEFLDGKYNKVVYFHWWNKDDVDMLPQLLNYEK